MKERTDQNPQRFELHSGIMPRDGGIYPHLLVRQATEHMVEPLSEEEMMLSATPDTSPPKWHLAQMNPFPPRAAISILWMNADGWQVSRNYFCVYHFER